MRTPELATRLRERFGRKPEANLRFSTTFAEMGIHGPRQRNMGLELVPTSILHIPDGDSMVHIAVLNDSFAGWKLTDFLESAAAYKDDFASRTGIINDLNLPDKIRSGLATSNDKRLDRIHRTSPVTGEVYEEFDSSNNRSEVLRALEDCPEVVNDMFSIAWNTRFIDHDFGTAYAEEYIRRWMNIPQDEDLRENIRQRGLTELGTFLRYDDATRDSFNAFRAIDPSMTPWDLTEAYSTSSDPRIKQDLYNFAVSQFQFSPTTLVDRDTNRVFPSDTLKYHKRITATVDRTGEITFKAKAKGQKLRLVLGQAGEQNSDGNWKVTDMQIPPHGLSPVIAYRVNTEGEEGPREERVLLTQSELLAILKDNNIILPHGMTPDVSLGRMALGYLSPEVVDDIEQEMALFRDNPKAERQALKGAQSLILYALSKHTSRFYREGNIDGPADKLLAPHNPVIAAIESTA